MSNIEKFMKLEDDLFNVEIMGEKFWHLVRFGLYMRIMELKEGMGKPHGEMKKGSLIRKLFRVFRSTRYVYPSNWPAFLKNRDVLISNHPRRVKNGDHYDCIYTDLIASNLDYSYYVFERPYYAKHYSPVKTDNIIYSDVVRFRTAVKRMVAQSGFFKSPINAGEADILHEIIRMFSKKFDVSLDPEIFISLVERSIVLYKTYSQYYEKVLKKVEPGLIIEVDSYSICNLALNTVAKSRGIPTVELQHGVMGKYHVGYNFSRKMDLPGFPDYLFLFGRFWQDTTQFPIDLSKIRIVGWPYYENKFLHTPENKSGSGKKRILFISQGTVGNTLSQIAVEISKRNEMRNYEVVYKLHPGEYADWREVYPWLIEADVEVVAHSDHDIHYYLSIADVQIGVHSTAIFEGIGYGIKTIIVKAYGCEYMEELIDNGFAYLVDNTDEAVEIILHEKHEKVERMDYFWEPDSLRKSLDAMEEIISMAE